MNNLKTTLHDKVVVVRENTHTGTTSDPLTRLFKCVSGEGCYPSVPSGVTIHGFFLKNFTLPKTQGTVISSDEIERFATERELEMAQ
jgi:hypothetical protein